MQTIDSTSSTQDIFLLIQAKLVELFELAPEDVTPDARLADDLDIDSIDAIDLIVELRKIIGKRIDPADFKSVKTVGDVVAAMQHVIAH